MTVAGFPHSGITGSQPACGSPMLFAAYHALPRLSVPRHPPCALVRLTGISSDTPPPIRTHNLHTRRTTTENSRFPGALPRPFTQPSTQIVKNDHSESRGTRERKIRPKICGNVRPVSPFGVSPHLLGMLQKGGDPAAGSPTATLLRLRPSHQARLRPLPPCGWLTDFGRSQLPWRDGRCVQGPGTDSPWRS
jgi:hypothetical protein